MTVQELLDVVYRALDESSSNSHYSSATIVALFNQAIREINKKSRREGGLYSFTSTSGVRAYALPNTLQRIKSVYYDDTILEEVDLDEINFRSTSSSGTPGTYAIHGGTIFFDSCGGLDVDIYCHLRINDNLGTADLAAEPGFYPEDYHSLLSEWALAELFFTDRNLQDSAAYIARFKEDLQEYINLKSRARAGRLGQVHVEW